MPMVRFAASRSPFMHTKRLRVVKWIKVVALYLLVIGVYYAILAYIGDFSARQSIVLAFLLSSLSSD